MKQRLTDMHRRLANAINAPTSRTQSLNGVNGRLASNSTQVINLCVLFFEASGIFFHEISNLNMHANPDSRVSYSR